MYDVKVLESLGNSARVVRVDNWIIELDERHNPGDAVSVSLRVRDGDEWTDLGWVAPPYDYLIADPKLRLLIETIAQGLYAIGMIQAGGVPHRMYVNSEVKNV